MSTTRTITHIFDVGDKVIVKDLFIKGELIPDSYEGYHKYIVIDSLRASSFTPTYLLTSEDRSARFNYNQEQLHSYEDRFNLLSDQLVLARREEAKTKIIAAEEFQDEHKKNKFIRAGHD